MPCQACSIFVLRKSERPAVWTLTNPKVHKANIFLWVSLNSIKWTSKRDLIKGNRLCVITTNLCTYQAFCGEFRLENIIKRYSNYLPFEVKIKDKVLNQVKALWTQSKNDLSDDDYKSFYKQFSCDCFILPRLFASIPIHTLSHNPLFVLRYSMYTFYYAN